ncbi:hypothetical protein ILYODFUR_033822, partial [Ilyodon furcidens]
PSQLEQGTSIIIHPLPRQLNQPLEEVWPPALAISPPDIKQLNSNNIHTEATSDS